MQKRYIDFIWCFLLALYILAGASLVPLHGDESTLIFMGRDFYYLVNGQSVALQDWDSLSGEAATEQQLRLLNGTVSKYLYGAAAYFMGYSFEDINQQWVWGAGWGWNHENGHVPDATLLLATRLVSSVQLTISALAIFALGSQFGRRGAGYFVSFIYTMNPAILLNGRRAMMEGSMLAFTILAVLVALYLLKHRTWWLYLLLGIFSGLALASKHTSVVTIFAIFFACGVYFLWRGWRQKEAFVKPIVALFLSGLFGISVFFGLNPAWWGNPLEAAKTVLTMRQELLAEQVEFFGGYANFSEQASGFLQQVFSVPPMYAETEIDGFVAEQAEIIRNYESSFWDGLRFGNLGALVMATLLVFGLWAATKRDLATFWLLALWSLAMIALTLFLTPLEWQRYYLPIYPPFALFTGLGLDICFQWLKNAYDKQRKTKSV